MTTHYKSFKLKNGELMAAEMDENITMFNLRGRLAITVINPVVLNSFKFLDDGGELVETISMMPMIPLSKETNFDIAADHIFSIAEMSDHSIERYKTFLEVLQSQDREDQEEEQEQVNADDNFSVLNINDIDTKIVH